MALGEVQLNNVVLQDFEDTLVINGDETNGSRVDPCKGTQSGLHLFYSGAWKGVRLEDAVVDPRLQFGHALWYGEDWLEFAVSEDGKVVETN